MKTLLLTNDDGYLSEGIQHLKRQLSESYDVYIVAPDRERSAVSMSLTINHPLRMKKINDKEYVIDGTPADCVNIGLQKILPKSPDFIVSGMNEGENLCEDVFFSGTVAAAFTGHMYGIPAMAVSLITDYSDAPVDYAEGARIAEKILAQLMPLKDTSIVYNLNIPQATNGKLAITSLGLKQYQPSIVERTDPRNRKYFWIGTGMPQLSGGAGTDLEAVKRGDISLSVIKYDINSPDDKQKLQEALDGYRI
jgi:5'/3'-nucleotidase